MTDGGSVDVQCPRALLAGDRLVITQEGAKRTIRIPAPRLRLDIKTDQVTGSVPTSDLDLRVTLIDYIGDAFVDNPRKDLTAAADGTFSAVVSDVLDLRGTDEAYLAWTRGGDRFGVLAYAPGARVQAGTAKVKLYGTPGTTIKLTLRNSSGTVKAAVTKRMNRIGQGKATLRRNGSTVKIKPGDRVTVAGVPGRMTVLTPDVAVDPANGGTVTGTRRPDGPWYVGTVNNGLNRIFRVGTAGAGGEVDETSISGTDPLPSGFRAHLGCDSTHGIGQLMIDVVP